MAERGLGVDHSTIGRWVLRYAPELHKRTRRDTRTPNRSWRVDETDVRVAGRWTCLYRAVDSRMARKPDSCLTPPIKGERMPYGPKTRSE
jgi:transposase-like protein